MRMRALALCALLLAGHAHAQQDAPPQLRLPDSVRPVHYAAELSIVPGEDRFAGAIEIEIEVKRPVEIVWLNARLLQIERAWLPGEGANARIVPGGEEFVGLRFERALAPGTTRLRIEYRGEIGKKDTQGVFALREGDDWYAFTQFEPYHARRAFPCFDEPGYKVPWQLNLVVPAAQVAVSNTPSTGETPLAGGMKRVAFAETRPLPSYLVAFGVGPFDIVDAGRAGAKSTPIRILAPRGMREQARYAARMTPRVLALAEKFTGVPYPYKKLDQLAVPITSGFGAMENAGLITYVMPLLLAREESDSFKQGFVQVAAHEIAHMWFGDLVTHAWWNDIWLNESFATWMADKIADRIDPSWNVKAEAMRWRGEAMANDGLASARMIRQPIESKSDIINAFDSITYAKGGAVLSMFEDWLGEARFRRGIVRYLGRHADANARAEDFLAELEPVGGESPGPAFATFLDQPGVPLVSLELRCDARGARLLLSQRRLVPLGSALASTSGAHSWQVPVCLRHDADGKSRRICTLLKAETAAIALGNACPTTIAPDTARYYRVRYAEGRTLRAAAPRGAAATAAFIGDLAALAHTGTPSLAQALHAVQPYARAADRHAVETLLDFLLELRGLVPQELRGAEARWIRSLFGARAHALGLRPKGREGENARLLRPPLVAFVADEGDDRELGAQAAALVHRWLRDRGAIDAETLQSILASAARRGDADMFAALKNEADRTHDRRERRYLFEALGSFQDVRLTRAALALVPSPEYDIRESMRIAWTVAADPRRAELAYRFMKDNFDALEARSPRDAAARYPQLAASLCDAAARDDVEAFFRDRAARYTGGARILAQTLESIALCSAFKQAQQPSFAAFLRQPE